MRTVSDVPVMAARQGGVFTVAQARANGWTTRQIRRRLSAGRWIYVAGRVLAQAPGNDGDLTDFQLALAARITLPGSIISHHTAAGLHGFPVARQQTAHVISDHRHDRCHNIKIHRLRLDEHEVTIARAGLRLTDPQRTALDVLAILSPDDALDLWAWVSSRKILDVTDLESALERRRHWFGTTNLRTLLRATRGGAASRAESLLHGLLRDVGIIGWVAGATISDRLGVIGVVDLLFGLARVVIEVDGFRAHSTRQSFVTDRRRQNRLIDAGYIVLRFTWDDLIHHPEKVITTIRRHTT